MSKVRLAACLILGALFVAIISVACGSGANELSGKQDVPRSTKTQEPTSVFTKEARTYNPPHAMPGPAVNKVQFRSSYVDQAVNELTAKNIDLYLFGVKIAAAKELQNNQGIQSFRSPASSVSLILNPAPDKRGLNPFSIKEVRQAVSFLIDRELIVQETYGGFAVPMTSQVSPVDFDYLTVADDLAGKNIRYDFDYAKSAISEEMRKAGAELTDGKWNYKGKPVKIKFIIRVEDERRDVGDLIRVALERVGFEVQTSYKTFAAAVSTVYTSDPQSFEWHLYTEGWGRGSADKYDFANINAMSAPWMGNMPGWQIAGFWQYQNESLDKLGKKLFTGNFSSKEERAAIYREMSSLALDESVRIWVATVYGTFPADKNLSGVTEDLVAGPKNALALREAYLPGKDSLSVGNLWVWTERSTWNPIGGFGDVYSIDIWKNIYDPPMINHPFSGLPIPFRVKFEVESAGPRGKLTVPEGAVMWDAVGDAWVPVPAGTKATSKVVFDYSKYFQSRWHHGEKIGMADVLYGIYQEFESAYDPEKKQIEFVSSAVRKPVLDTFRGFRVLDENRVEVYLDFWHFEPSYIAFYASLTSLPLPWEVMATMDKIVYEDRLGAYSQSSAARFSVPWISLVMEKDASLVARALREFGDKKFLPSNILMNFETEDGAQARFHASVSWFEKHRHLVVSQGPFMLNTFNPSAQYAELLAFRDEHYPFKPGDWYMGKADLITISSPDNVTVKKGNQAEIKILLQGSGNLGLQYMLYDESSGEMIGQGSFETSERKEFHLVFSPTTLNKSKGSTLRLRVLAHSDALALVREKKIDITMVQP